MNPTLPEGWTLTASAFNWTPEVIRAQRSATAITAGIIESGISRAVEVEAGQLWRGFPVSTDAEIDATAEAIVAAGGSVSIVGASIDDWSSATRRRSDAERLAFLLPQLRAAHRLGALGVRLPIGQAGPQLLAQLLPHLHELDLVLFEEMQGQQTPDREPQAAPIEDIARLDDPHVRLLLDISMLMPSLPPTYLDILRSGGVASELLYALEHDWREPGTHDAVLTALHEGAVPAAVHTLFMNLLVRFGRSDAADLRSILPLVSGVHLKFWDLDDTDGRVSQPIRDIARELTPAGFTGTLCSEWGGHEWLDDDPAVMTRAHLALAERAVAGAVAAA